MRVATWNVNSLRVRLDHLRAWLDSERPDIFCLQETKVVDADFPQDALGEAGYRALIVGQKTYNGVAMLLREGLEAGEMMTALPGAPDEQARFVAATVDGTRVINVYVPNGSEVGSDKFAYKLAWLARLRELVVAERARYDRLLVCGDFNIAPTDLDVYDPEAWTGKILCSSEERAAFGRLLEGGLVDLFRSRHEEEPGFSWWDYRQGAFRRDRGIRIDHLLVSPALAGACTGCHVDRAPRALERPSDHTPVVADFSG